MPLNIPVRHYWDRRREVTPYKKDKKLNYSVLNYSAFNMS